MLISKAFGVNIILICFGISAILYTIFEYVVPRIMKIKTTNKINEWYDDHYKNIKELSKNISEFKQELYDATSKFHTLEERQKAAIKLSDSIVRFLIEPSIKEE